nr:O-antigen ligase family protein [Streptomyces roseochromogenus]
MLGLPVAPESNATPADAVSALVVLWAVVHTACQARRPLTRTAAVVLGLPVVGLAVAASGAVTPAEALTGLARYLQVFVLVPVAVVLLVRDRRDARLLLWALVGLALWQGAVGVHQYLTGTGASYQGAQIRAVGTFGPADVMGMATAVSFGLVAAVGLALGPVPEVPSSARRAGPPGECVPGAAGLGAPPTPFKAVGEGLPAQDPGERARRQRLVAAACALALLLPLTVSFSRGAWIATAVACGAQLLTAGARRAAQLVAAAVAASVVLVGGFGVGAAVLQERLTSITRVADAPDQSVVDRYSLWTAATGMWRGHPVTGVGLKAFPAYRDGHAPLALSSGSDTDAAGWGFRRRPLLSPHNMYLLVLSEQGLLGAVTVVGSWLALLVCATGRLRRAGRARDCAVAACGLLLWQYVDFLYADIGGPSTVLTGVCLGLGAWWALARESTTGTAVKACGR